MKYLYSFVIISITFYSFSQSEVYFKGKITNPNHEKVSVSQTIMQDGHRTQKSLGEAELDKNGTFSLSFEVSEQIEAVFSDGNERTTFLIQPGDDLYLTLNTKVFDETIEYSGKGSEKNNAIKNMALMMENSLSPVFEFEPDTDTTEVYSYINNAMDELIAIVKDYQAIEDFSAFGDRLITEYEETKTGLKAQYKQNLEMKIAFDKMIGTDAIDIKGIKIDGSETNLADYKGKLIIVDFWATWCAPCKAEMPAFIELEEKYGDEVNFISMAVYCKEDGWKKMATDYGFKNNIYVSKETQDQFADWKVNFIPRYFIVGKDFKVIDSDAPRPSSGELEVLIEELK